MPSYQETLKEVKAEIAELEPKYAALQEAKRALEKLIGFDSTKQINVHLPTTTFKGLKTWEAILKCLYLVKHPLKSRQIADALEEAGFEHGSKNLSNNVNSILDRIKGNGYVRKEAEGWRIAEGGKQYIEKNDPSLVPENHQESLLPIDA